MAANPGWDDLRRSAWRRAVDAARAGEGLSQADIDSLAAEWDALAGTDVQAVERFPLLTRDGACSGPSAPRWLCHLLGLRHGAVEVGLCTESGLVILQRRSDRKREYPGCVDMPVAGHVTACSDGEPLWHAEAVREMEEEIGLGADRLEQYLTDGGLERAGDLYESVDQRDDEDPPVRDVEVRAIFSGVVSGRGLAAIRLAADEVGSLILLPPDGAARLLADGGLASGARDTLPRWLPLVHPASRAT